MCGVPVYVDKINAFHFDLCKLIAPTPLKFHYYNERETPLLASLDVEVSVHWQHEGYLGHVKFVSETAVKADKDMKKN